MIENKEDLEMLVNLYPPLPEEEEPGLNEVLLVKTINNFFASINAPPLPKPAEPLPDQPRTLIQPKERAVIIGSTIRDILTPLYEPSLSDLDGLILDATPLPQLTFQGTYNDYPL